MLSALQAWGAARRIDSFLNLCRARSSTLRSLVRRLIYFWVVWSALLTVHESGHAVVGMRRGLDVDRITVGVGPALWRAERGDTELVLRLVPIAGITTLSSHARGTTPGMSDRQRAWRSQLATVAGGLIATLVVALAVGCAVAARERSTGKRWKIGRFIVADAVVITVLNLLPVPPLDGGRVVLGAIVAWQGMPLSGDALFWVHVGGLMLAAVPMMIWTRWTARIDAVAFRFGAPRETHRSPSQTHVEGSAQTGNGASTARTA